MAFRELGRLGVLTGIVSCQFSTTVPPVEAAPQCTPRATKFAELPLYGSPERTGIERAVEERRVLVVHFDGCSFELLPGCTTPATLGEFTWAAYRREDRVVPGPLPGTTTDEAVAGSVNASEGEAFRLEVAQSGFYATASNAVEIDVDEPACERATHAIVQITVGAFRAARVESKNAVEFKVKTKLSTGGTDDEATIEERWDGELSACTQPVPTSPAPSASIRERDEGRVVVAATKPDDEGVPKSDGTSAPPQACAVPLEVQLGPVVRTRAPSANDCAADERRVNGRCEKAMIVTVGEVDSPPAWYRPTEDDAQAQAIRDAIDRLPTLTGDARGDALWQLAQDYEARTIDPARDEHASMALEAFATDDALHGHPLVKSVLLAWLAAAQRTGNQTDFLAAGSKLLVLFPDAPESMEIYAALAVHYCAEGRPELATGFVQGLERTYGRSAFWRVKETKAALRNGCPPPPPETKK